MENMPMCPLIVEHSTIDDYLWRLREAREVFRNADNYAKAKEAEKLLEKLEALNKLKQLEKAEYTLKTIGQHYEFFEMVEKDAGI